MSLSPSSYPISLQDAASGETLIIAALDGNTDIPIMVQALQVGGPDVREVVNDMPNQDGVQDSTQFHGARAVTLAVTIPPRSDAHTIEDQLVPWMKPSRRSWLIVQRTGWDAPRRMLIRGDQFGAPTTFPGPTVQMLLAWKNPTGVWESVDEFLETVFPAGVTTTGMHFPVVFPMNFGTGAAAGAGFVTIGGDLPTPPLIRIYGPVTGPSIANETTGQTFTFKASAVIPNGTYWSIDMANRTVLANDDPSISRMDQVNFSATQFWQLQPGVNQIAFTGTALSGITQTTLTYRERRF